MKKGKRFGVIFVLFGLILFLIMGNVYAQTTTSQDPSLLDVSKWTSKNWQKIAEMDSDERDAVWQKASSTNKNNAIKELGSKEEKTSGGFFGMGGTKEDIALLIDEFILDANKLYKSFDKLFD